MGVIWHKVWFDIWHSKVRTALAVLSIAAGVFAVGTIFGLTDQLYSGLDQAHQAVLPAHLNISLAAPIDRDTALALRKVAGVEGVEPYNEVPVRFKLQPTGRWETGIVTMRDDYERMKYDLLQLKDGTWPAGDTIGIERLSGQYWDIGIGDRVIFEVGNSERSLAISGKIRHPFVPPPRFGGEAFFFVDEQGMERFGVPKGQYTQLYVRVTPFGSMDYAREVAARIKDRLGKQGIGVAATLYQDPTKHWAREFIQGITLVLQVLAVLSLVMSVVLVLNTLLALITQQTSQIGMIKAIGGTRSTVIKLYLAGVLAYGVLALTVSLPVGLALAYLVSRWFLNLFNIDYDVFRWSVQAVALMALAALAVPLAAALWPVLRGAVITVREAMASYGLGGDFSSGRLDRAVERLAQRVLPAAYAMAIANTFRRRGRLLLSLLVLVTAGAMFLTVMTLSASINATLDGEFGRRLYDISLQFDRRERIDQAIKVAESVGGVAKASVWYVQPATILLEGHKAKEAGAGTEIVGVPLQDPMYRPLVVAGRWLQPGDDRALLMSEESAADNRVRVGDSITVDLGSGRKTDWQVVGLYKLVFGFGYRSDALYAPMQAVLAAAKKSDQGSRVYVRALTGQRGAAEVRNISDRLEKLFRAQGMEVRSSETIQSARASADSEFSVLTTMLLALALIVALVGGVGLTGSLAISVIERTKEIGVLRAIGARSRTISGMFLLEAVLHGLLSWAVAVPLSFMAGRPLADAMGQTMFSADLVYRYDFRAVAIWLAAILLIAAVASVLPARKAARISVRQSLAYE
jgi:putative ABC transport system permease protein